ncbi:MAG: hypothetical protein P8J51_05755 [Dehalococcoidia bacterium]|nr:hypothetical protein [Dehalococcoidia bacterium]
MQIYNLLKTNASTDDHLINVEYTDGSMSRLIRVKELKSKIDLSEFKKDDGLFWSTAAPDTYSKIVGSKFNINDGRTFKISWVKPLINDSDVEFGTIFNTFTAILLVRRLS